MPIIFMLFTLDWRFIVGQIGIIWGVNIFILEGRSVYREVEADKLGMVLASKAGFEAAAAAQIWGKLCSFRKIDNLAQRMDAMCSLS
jgi:hypothetical protein